MNYDIPEIQDVELEEGMNVIIKSMDYEERLKTFFITRIRPDGNYDIRNKITGTETYASKEDLIFNPNIEWFLEHTKMKTSRDISNMMGEFYSYRGLQREQYHNNMNVKELHFYLFMFKQGKVLKEGKWAKIEEICDNCDCTLERCKTARIACCPECTHYKKKKCDDNVRVL